MSQYWIDLFSAVLTGMMLLLALLGLVLAAVVPGMDRRDKRFFVCYFAMFALSVSALFAYPIASVDPNLESIVPVSDYCGSLIMTALVAMPALYLLHCCGENWRKSVLFRIVLVLWVACFVLLGVSLGTNAFYTYDPGLSFHFGPWYPLLLAPIALILIVIFAAVIRRKEKLSRKHFRAFLIYLIPLACALVIHAISPSFVLLYIGITVSSLAMFAIVVTEQIEQYMKLQRETVRQRASIAVLQMRPHFIHNTMTSIYYLCEQDPKTAQQVTMDFNTYLRKNFTAIAKDELISFAEELEHARAYLAVEQAQFSSKLVVNYDTPHIQFRLPPLTLQPIVENAVKHGMTPETVPLHIRIQTRNTDSASEVIVEDNGPGFDHTIAKDPHTTLANIQQRLEMMCHGTLEYESREGGGTVVKITVPH